MILTIMRLRSTVYPSGPDLIYEYPFVHNSDCTYKHYRYT